MTKKNPLKTRERYPDNLHLYGRLDTVLPDELLEQLDTILDGFAKMLAQYLHVSVMGRAITTDIERVDKTIIQLSVQNWRCPRHRYKLVPNKKL